MEKILGTFLSLLVVLAPKTVNADCRDCIELEPDWHFYEHRIRDGPCFNYRDKKVCYVKSEAALCHEEDLLCKLTDKTVEDCGALSRPPTGSMAPHWRTRDQCETVITIDVDTCHTKDDADFYKCRYGSDHTMVKYGPGAGEHCRDVCSYGFSSQAEIDAIVDKHNELRAKVANCNEDRAFNSTNGQPCARNMNKLKWDSELAKVAQRWAQACDGQHDKLRLVPDFSYVGQNWAGSSASDITKLRTHESSIQAWYNEVEDMNPEAVTSFNKVGTVRPGTVIGHYSQLVWASTTHVGCGTITYMFPKNGNAWFGEAFVCNYGEGGNWIGSSIYDIASNATETGTGCPGEVENGLCV